MTTSNEAPEAPVAKKSRAGRYVILIVALAFLALLAYGLVAAGDQRVEAGTAPDFELTTFDGEELRLSDMRGQVVVLNFWATWCLECKREATDLEMAWRDYKDRGVQFIGVDYLDQEPLNFEYLEEFDVTYPNGMDVQGRIYNAYGVQGLPETFIINQQGEIVKVYIGALTRAELSAVLDGLLDG